MLSSFEAPGTPSRSEMDQGSSPADKGPSSWGGPTGTPQRFPLNSQTLAGIALVAAMQLYDDKASAPYLSILDTGIAEVMLLR